MWKKKEKRKAKKQTGKKGKKKVLCKYPNILIGLERYKLRHSQAQRQLKADAWGWGW
jgi:hypothetical protein